MNKTNAIKVLTREEEAELLKRAQKGKTLYDILGISHNASEKKIREAYENKLKDKEKNKTKFQEIQEAYEILSDKKTKAIYDKKNKDLFLERDEATRLLVYYNQSFVKYMVKGYHYPQGEINADELTAEGVISLPKAIKDFDLAKSENRMASFAGHWIRHHIRSFIIKSRLLPQATPKKKPNHLSEEEEETEKKIPRKSSSGIIYYDKIYQSSERDDKITSLLDTLADKNEGIEKQIQQKETKEKINKMLTFLEPHEELIIRLFSGVSPTDLSQINRLANEEKAKELKKTRDKSKKNSLLFEKYSSFFATPRRKEEVVQELINREFWEYFREFPKLAAAKDQTSRRSNSKTSTSNQPINSAEKKKWYNATQNNLKDDSFSESMAASWINLGYQPEDITDSQNQILQRIGISKKEKEQWQKASSKAKNKDNWLEQRLGKTMENLKKNILKKLKGLTEKKPNSKK
ncbi:DnaJ domain-containing protein [endosymbiont GvMRE of Glomus versiforme]|uniref:DnaJ domain-containing protein n=1 Tax=endosymbiont GvMRE of Glomus versiforme TaxID=2039283 RepID=UPI000EDBC762|nr:DnaJ domain-containing protein [endosymbiont GvMRE of Glomus versiforme]RHZ37327.1 RNA polymerase sigma factor RpoH [endosymbiont GvMRE of Glomus versiforme]